MRELSALPGPLQGGALAGAVLALAGRLDAGPSDREAAMLARELRLALADLRAQAGAVPDRRCSVSTMPRWAPEVTASPRWATERTDRETYGGTVAEVAAVLGIELMPWQRRVLDVALEHEGGRLAYRDVVVTVPRQSGKSTLLLPVIVWRMLAARSTLIYGAQSRLAARQKLLDDLLPILARSRLAKSFTATRATGQEALRAPTGRCAG